MASIQKRPDGQWRARYRDGAGKEHAHHFPRKIDAQRWLNQESAKLQTGTWVDPRLAKLTVGQWCATWLAGYATRKPSTVRMAQVHVGKIVEHFGTTRLDAVRPSDVKSWLVKLQSEHAPSYVYALHARLAQVFSDAVHDGVLVRSPTSRRTSPPAGNQRPYVATTEQVWALHDALGERYRAALLLAAFAGLRLAETCGLRVDDVDFMRGTVSPVRQYPSEPLKTEMSRTPVPIPADLALTLSAHVAEFSEDGWLLTDDWGHQLGPWQLQRAFRSARAGVDVPGGFRFHDLRHYYASALIAGGLDIKTVQMRMRHASGKTTIDTYGHMFPDTEDATRAAVAKAIAARPQAPADYVRTRRGGKVHPP